MPKIRLIIPIVLLTLVLLAYFLYTSPARIGSILPNHITHISVIYSEGSLEEKQAAPITDTSKIDEFLNILNDYTYHRKLSFSSTAPTYPVDKVSHIMLNMYSEKVVVSIQLLSNGELLVGNNPYGVNSLFDNSKAKELYGRIRGLIKPPAT